MKRRVVFSSERGLSHLVSGLVWEFARLGSSFDDTGLDAVRPVHRVVARDPRASVN